MKSLPSVFPRACRVKTDGLTTGAPATADGSAGCQDRERSGCPIPVSRADQIPESEGSAFPRGKKRGPAKILVDPHNRVKS